MAYSHCTGQGPTGNGTDTIGDIESGSCPCVRTVPVSVVFSVPVPDP